ncbi:MAG: MmcQ/YjbR family DNA-binding protein [Planctomycetota bacterium]
MARKIDQMDAMMTAARALGDVDEGTSCSQTSFKIGGKPFLYIGEQGGRYKAMFRLKTSLDEADAMAADAPKDVQVGKNGWVTARFSAEHPMAARTWKKWLKESFAIAGG